MPSYGNADQVWLPIKWNGDTPSVTRVDQWTPEVPTSTMRFAFPVRKMTGERFFGYKQHPETFDLTGRLINRNRPDIADAKLLKDAGTGKSRKIIKI
jgi:hypothetical protein